MVDEKTEYKMTVKNDKREFVLSCATDSPLGELFDAVCEFQLLIIKKMKEIQPKQPDVAEDPIEVS